MRSRPLSLSSPCRPWARSPSFLMNGRGYPIPRSTQPRPGQGVVSGLGSQISGAGTSCSAVASLKTLRRAPDASYTVREPFGARRSAQRTCQPSFGARRRWWRVGNGRLADAEEERSVGNGLSARAEARSALGNGLSARAEDGGGLAMPVLRPPQPLRTNVEPFGVCRGRGGVVSGRSASAAAAACGLRAFRRPPPPSDGQRRLAEDA